MDKRKLDIVILSDVHLGTYECHATELLKYLSSIQPEVMVLNGDFIDIAQLNKKQFPKKHAKIIREIVKMAASGTKVYYITSNKEPILKRLSEFSLLAFDVRERLVLQLRGQKYWIFHGGSFKPIFGNSIFLATIVHKAYGWLLRGNRLVNKWRITVGKARLSYTGKIKNKVKQTVQLITQFEETAVKLASQQGYDYVVCGHIHQPTIKKFENDDSAVTYMNAGDWVENLTSLEYRFGKWKLYEYDELDYNYINPRLKVKVKKVTDTEVEPTTSSFGAILESKKGGLREK